MPYLLQFFPISMKDLFLFLNFILINLIIRNLIIKPKNPRFSLARSNRIATGYNIREIEIFMYLTFAT